MHNQWTAEEDEILRNHYYIEGREVVKRLPNRTMRACFSRAQKLGLSWDRDSGIVGHRFGKLVVVERAGVDDSNYALYSCRCDCGNTHVAAARYLKEGRIQSCGCLTTGRKAISPDYSAFNRLYGRYKEGATKRGYEFHLTKEEFRDLTSSECFYCGAKPLHIQTVPKTNSEYKFNGIDRINNSRGYVYDNCVPSCETCNKAKRVLDANEFIQWAIRIADKWRDDDTALALLESRIRADAVAPGNL